MNKMTNICISITIERDDKSMFTKKVNCEVNIGATIIREEVMFTQENDCSIKACIPIQNSESVETINQINIFGVASNDEPILKECKGEIVTNNSVSVTVIFPNIEFKKASISLNNDTVTLKVYVTNLPYFKRHGSIDIEGYCFHVRPHNEGSITNCIQIMETNYEAVESILQIVDKLCWLNSFAAGSLSSIARVEVFRNDECLRLIMRAVNTTLTSPTTLIYEDGENENIIKFLEHSYGFYKVYNDQYLLNNLINTSILAKQTKYIETKLLLMCNFLEILRYNYAKNIGVANNIFIQSKNNFKWNTGTNSGKTVSFKEILLSFLTSNNITGWSDDYLHIRNEIVHTGHICNNEFERYYNLHHFCDRIILAILKWDSVSGLYIPINQQEIGVEVNNTTFVR